MKFKNKYYISGFIFLALFLAIFTVACTKQNSQQKVALPRGDTLEGQDCNADVECQSGVCDFIKQDWGKCAPVNCAVGTQAQGISDIAFFCNQNNEWQLIKKIGENCANDYECFKAMCKDNPGCHPGDYRYYCKNNVCAAERQLNECEVQGLQRVSAKEAVTNSSTGECQIFIEQREEPTVCAPCGNGICEADLESKCNCPADCE